MLKDVSFFKFGMFLCDSMLLQFTKGIITFFLHPSIHLTFYRFAIQVCISFVEYDFVMSLCYYIFLILWVY